jgi:hypothetical protein
LALLAIGTLGCGKPDRGRGERTAQLASCTDALEKAGSAPAGEQAEILARGCPATCDGLGAWLAAQAVLTVRPGVFAVASEPADAPPPLVALVAGCHTGCDAAAATGRVPAAMRWPALLDVCGADALGLPREQETLASEEGVVLAEVSRWIERTAHAGVSDAQLAARIEHVSLSSLFALPLPAHPGVPASRFRSPSHARQFVMLEDELRVGTVPHVRLRGGRLDVIAVPGAYPGQRVDVDQLAAVLAQHAEVLVQLGAPVTAPPLVIADSAVPLSRILDLITRLGVDRDLGADTHAHPVLLERPARRLAIPEIVLDDHGISLRGFGDDRQTDWDHLDAELDNFAAVNAPIRALELHALPGSSVADLVRILDACVIARISALVFVPAP